MSERDPVALLLKTLERPVAPRCEFADALRGHLLTELAEANGHRSWVPQLTMPPRPRRSRRMLAAALAIVLIASAVVAVLVTRPAPASALGLIRHAQRQVASLPPFEATVRYDINPDGKGPGGLNPKGATETMQVSYGGPKRLRTVISAEHTTIPGARPVGSYDVVNGNHYGSYDAQRKIFQTGTVGRYTRPLGDLAWKGGYPDWQKVCRGSAGQVLPDARVAGRDTRHIRCTPGAQVWQLWIDRQTGLLLKLVGQTGGEDLFFDAAPLTSQRGGFTITRLRYHPTFPAGTFKIAAPSGSLDYQARLREAEAKLPPFRALLSGRSHNGRLQLLEQFWWQDNGTWRVNSLAGQAIHGGPGSFEVSAHGSVRSYNARDHSYSTSDANPNYPIADLLPEDDPRYPGACPIVGHDQIEGRPAIHRRCPDRETWIDAATGLTLQTSAPGYQVRLRNLHYHPAFPPGTLHFTRPPRSRSAQQLANDPYYKTRLKPGHLAPNWRARKLNGGRFQTTDLLGRPALLLLLPDWCTDPACYVFTPLERVYKRAKDKLAIIWVDFSGKPAQAKKLIRHDHLTFPVVIDDNSGRFTANSIQAWRIQAYPYWALLDSRGRVIEARFKPQTLAQLRQLVNEAK